MSDPEASATDSRLGRGGTALGQARGTEGRGVQGDAPPARAIERLEFHAEDIRPWVRVLVKGGEYFALRWVAVPEATTLPAGSYVARITPTDWELTWNGGAAAAPPRPYVITQFDALAPPLVRAIEVTAGVVPARVVRQQRPVPGPPPAMPSRAATAAGPAAGPDAGRDAAGPDAAARSLAFPLVPDPGALARSQELRDFAWQLLEHFLSAPAMRGRRITIGDLDSFAAQRPAVAALLSRLTQAWAEMQRTHNPTLARFKPLAELIVEQYVFGNDTIVLNQLAIRDAPLALGLYHRASGLKYYDDHGLPALDILQTNRRDVYYASQPRPVFRYAPATRDWASLKLVQMLSTDPEIVAVVEGIWANLDLFASHPPSIDKALHSMRHQASAILLFMAAEGVLILLERIGSPREKLIAKLLHLGLVLTGRLLQIRFVIGLKETIFEIGHHLYRVKRRADNTPDDLSREHIERAMALAQPLLEEILGLALAAGALKVATATAPFLDPPGGPGSLMFVPASAGGASGGTAASNAAGAAGQLPGFIVVMGATRQPAGADKAEEGMDDKPRTPRELEQALFGKDKRPDTPFYLSRENKSLRVMLEELLAHIANPENAKYYKPAGKPPIRVDPEALNIKTIVFLKQPQHKVLLARYWELVAEAQKDVKDLGGRTDSAAKRIEAAYDAIQAFGEGILGDKRPDKVEIFIERRQFATTDASFAWYTKFHNFKHEVYVAALKAATDLEGAGLEIETLPRSRLIEPEIAPEVPAPPENE